jgi:ADP-ribosylglycohydrolase
MDKITLKRCIDYAMVGDALGFLVEAKEKKEVDKLCEILKTKNLHQNTHLLNVFNIEDWLTHEKYTPGQISDDSQSMLALAESYLEKPQNPIELFAHKMKRLFDENKMVGYGRTTKYAIDNFSKTGNWKTCGDKKRTTNGSVMRVAPLGILFSDDTEALVNNCILQSQFTHPHPFCILSSIAFATVVACLYKNASDMRIISSQMRQNFAKCETNGTVSSQDIEYFDKFIKHLGELTSIDASKKFILDVDKSIHKQYKKYGISTHTTTCTFWSIYSYFINKDKNLENTLADTISIGGDTDTVATMTAILHGIQDQKKTQYIHWIHDKNQKPHFKF